MAVDSPLVRRGVDNPHFLPAVVRDLICSLLGDIWLARRFCPPACARTFLVMDPAYANSENIAAITEAEWRARMDPFDDEDEFGEDCELCGLRQETRFRHAFNFFTIHMHREVDILPYKDMVTSMIEKAMDQQDGAVSGVGEGQVCWEVRLCCLQCCLYVDHL